MPCRDQNCDKGKEEYTGVQPTMRNHLIEDPWSGQDLECTQHQKFNEYEYEFSHLNIKIIFSMILWHFAKKSPKIQTIYILI